MSTRPITTRVAQSAALKWVAGITAAVIGALIVFVLTSTAKAVISQSERIAVIEARAEARDDTLNRIEAAVLVLDEKISRMAVTRLGRRSSR